MAERLYAAWKHGNITVVLPMVINAAFPTVAKGRQVKLIMTRQM